MSRSITLLGLDCGSTTTSMVVAAARLEESATGRKEITELTTLFRSPLEFTPFDEDRLDRRALEQLLQNWLAQAAVEPAELFGGGALVTGLAARRANATCIAELVESRLADAVVAASDDPVLESWLAFMGNCHTLSRTHPSARVLNIDIGGGTTKLAWGLDGRVIATASLLVGARHFQFHSGTYQVTSLTPEAMALAEHLQIDVQVGRTLDPTAITSIVDWYVELIEAVVRGEIHNLRSSVAERHVQFLPRHVGTADVTIALSGGVGQLVYDALRGQNTGAVSQFGDLGGELASRIIQSPLIAGGLAAELPEGLGRATVYGLLRHATELSGATIYLPHPRLLPIKNVPIVGRIGPDSSDESIRETLALASHAQAACVQVDLAADDEAAVIPLAERIRGVIASSAFPTDRVLVLLSQANFGKVLGAYVSRWGSLPLTLIVLDELPLRDAQFVRLGRLQQGAVGVSLYGMNAEGAAQTHNPAEKSVGTRANP